MRYTILGPGSNFGHRERKPIKHALKNLKIHHSLDCFHVIYEIGKSTAVAIASKVRKAQHEYEAQK
jgi:hypothetical protein